MVEAFEEILQDKKNALPADGPADGEPNDPLNSSTQELIDRLNQQSAIDLGVSVDSLGLSFSNLPPPEARTALKDALKGGSVVPNYPDIGGLRRLHQPLRAASTRDELHEDIDRANRFGSGDRDTVLAIGRLISEKIERCREYVLGYREDYRMLVRVRGSGMGILIEKRGAAIESRVVEDASSLHVAFMTRAQYLRTSLTRRYGHEPIFVGCGGIFDYPNRAQAERNFQRELNTILRWHEQPPAARAGQSSPWVAAAKRMVKQAIGRTELDLYDLGSWTTWESH